jgi:hypothetical protein
VLEFHWVIILANHRLCHNFEVNRIRSYFSQNRIRLLGIILAPLIITRLALLLIGWFSLELAPDSGYPISRAPREGWAFSPHRWLDIWGRWDSGWYLDIALHGYRPSNDLQTEQSNLAFFPLYPYLIRGIDSLLPGKVQVQYALLTGVVISNICLLGACIILYLLARQLLGDDRLAERALWYLLLFPVGFILSAVYTEALFLFLSLLAFWSARRGSWALAGLAGFFLALTRFAGIFILPVLVWLYLEQRGWRIRPWHFPRLNWQLVWLLLVPAGFAVFLGIGYQATGDWLAYFHAHSAWGMKISWPWEVLLSKAAMGSQHNFLENFSLLIFLLLSLYALIRLPSPAYGLYALLLLLPAFTAGELVFGLRTCLVCFPAFLVLAQLGSRWRWLHQTIVALFLAFQSVLFALWTQFYWVG